MHSLFILIVRFMRCSSLMTAILLLHVVTAEATQMNRSALKYDKFGAQFVSLERRFHGIYSENSFTSLTLDDSKEPRLNPRVRRGVEESGVTKSPQLTLSILDAFDQPLTARDGDFTRLYVGDRIRFLINLTRDGIYDSLQVLQCVMSSSSLLQDSNAETRVLLVNGCPLLGEATANSWLWTSEKSTTASFVTNTQPVSIFRLSRSAYIYLHCAMKMCFVGADPCKQRTAADCTASPSGRKKRELVDGYTNATETAALHVIDRTQEPYNPLEVGSITFILLIVVLILIGLSIVVLVTILLVYLLCPNLIKRRHPYHPEQFAQQRITPARRNCPCCC